MYGWRAKIGLLIPSNNVVIEPEFYRMTPEGVSIHSTRMLTRGPFAQNLLDMEKNAYRGIDELAAGAMDIIAYACLSTGLVKGLGWSEDFIKEVEDRVQLPATTATLATIQALEVMGVEKVALATPFPPEVGELLPIFFKAYGIKIVSLRNMAVEDILEVGKISFETVYNLGKSVDSKEADAVCILATDIATIEILHALEESLKKPVVSTNQALLWKCLRLVHIEDDIPNYGSLLGKR